MSTRNFNVRFCARVFHFSLTFFTFVLGSTFLASTVHSEERGKWPINEIIQQYAINERTYVDTLPQELVTSFTKEALKEGTYVRIDATEGRVFFPFEREPRKFKSEQALKDFMMAHFGSEEHGVRGSYTKYDHSYFYDPEMEIVYQVDDPIMAKLGGLSGQVIVDGQPHCVDPDKDCSDEFASYLEPIGVETVPHTRDLCGDFHRDVRVCVRFHSFFHNFWFFGEYRRIGSNSQFTTWPAISSSELTARPLIFFGSSSWPLIPVLDGDGIARGVNAVEHVMYCHNTCWNNMLTAHTVCGEHSVADIDINVSSVTANGPGHDFSSPRCPSGR